MSRSERATEKFWKEKSIYHFVHEHRLDLCEKEGEVACQDCGESVHGWAYGCGSCSYFLHESCIGTPNPLHPEHRLKPSKLGRNCHVCVGFTDMAPSFRCSPCGFHLCWGCAYLVPILKVEHKGHTFCLLDFKERGYKMFRCISPGCNDSYYVPKGPLDLPESIVNRPCHWLHSLTFADRYVEPHIIGCFCDGCEEERDPARPVYRCEDCNFSAHAACALSEVLPAMVAGWEAAAAAKAKSDGGSADTSVEPALQELNKKIEDLKGSIFQRSRIRDFEMRELAKAEGVRDRYVVSLAGSKETK